MSDPSSIPRDWMFRQCSACGHLGFSHDNAADCAECECEGWTEGADNHGMTEEPMTDQTDYTDDPIPDETEQGEVTEVDPEPGERDDPVTQEPVEED